jgi:hypothetical protein
LNQANTNRNLNFSDIKSWKFENKTELTRIFFKQRGVKNLTTNELIRFIPEKTATILSNIQIGNSQFPENKNTQTTYLKFLRPLALFPFIKMIAIVNSKAFNPEKEGSDIDLFIITKTNRLFLARTILTLYFQILGKRRSGKEIKNKFCLSFFVDEQAMDLEKIKLKNDFYLYFWILAMKPIFGIKTFFSLLDENTWIAKEFGKSDIFPNLNDLQETKITHKIFKSFTEGIIEIFGAELFEAILRNWQLKRIQKKLSQMQVTEKAVFASSKILKFHDKDRRAQYNEELRGELVSTFK